MMMEPRLKLRELGDQINDICRKHNILKRDIAEKMDVSNSYLSQILQRGGTPDQIEKITDALNDLKVREGGQQLHPTYFDVYNALSIVEEARRGDPGAIQALNFYSAYRRAGDHPKKQRDLLGKLVA